MEGIEQATGTVVKTAGEIAMTLDALEKTRDLLQR
jgi:hypothetical protein